MIHHPSGRLVYRPYDLVCAEGFFCAVFFDNVYHFATPHYYIWYFFFLFINILYTCRNQYIIKQQKRKEEISHFLLFSVFHKNTILRHPLW